MSAYEELEERCSRALWTDTKYNGVRFVLAEVLRTLETWDGEWDVRDLNAFRTMLRETPLTPPKEASL